LATVPNNAWFALRFRCTPFDTAVYAEHNRFAAQRITMDSTDTQNGGSVRMIQQLSFFRSALLAAAGCLGLFASVPGAAQSPPRDASDGTGGRNPVGKPLLGAAIATPQVTISYPHNVEALLDITYASLPGYRGLTLDLYRVAGTTPKPLVLYVHGGSFLGGSTRMRHPVWGNLDGFMAYVASRGYVAAAVEYRFAAEARWPAQLQDVKSAIRFLRANAIKYGIDPQHVVVWGESAGGGLAAEVGTSCRVAEFDDGPNLEQSSCVQAVIDWYGVSDMNQLDAMAIPTRTLIHDSPDSSQSQVLGCVLKYSCPASVVAKANPITYIDASDANVSFLIMHGDKDTAVGPRQAQLLYDALRAKNVPAQIDIIPNVDHYFSGATAEQAQHILDTVFDFLTQSLVSGTRSATEPAKAR
jgi:acetyl esterase/lipase